MFLLKKLGYAVNYKDYTLAYLYRLNFNLGWWRAGQKIRNYVFLFDRQQASQYAKELVAVHRGSGW